MDGLHSDILIIGAGMAGLTCATDLAAAGLSVRVLDKGRGPGGRMAARRAEIAGETVSFDHGAQYFTARHDGFRETVLAWEKAGVVARWIAAGEDAWVGTPGMNAPIRQMAKALDVCWNTRAQSLTRTNDGWRVETEGKAYSAKTVLVAVPAEQAYDLLHSSTAEMAAIPASVLSEPCWALMVGFDRSLDVPKDVLRDSDAPISWAARNSEKPDRGGEECWVLHASPRRSREILDLGKEKAGEVLLADFFRQTGIAPLEPIHMAAHRWLYAMPAAVSGDAARFDKDQTIGIAGDYLHSPRVEGAWISGHTLAQKVLAASD